MTGVQTCALPDLPDPKSDANSNSNLGVRSFGVRGAQTLTLTLTLTLTVTLTLSLVLPQTRIWGCGVLG